MNADSSARGTTRAAAVILAAAAVFYCGFGAYAVLRGRTWSDEITYVAKSWWYVKGLVAPYSDADATWYMPLYFYQLGLVQMVFGAGLTTARIASLAPGALSAVLLFACVRKLSANAVAAALAVLVYAATPATTYYFATATPLSSVALLLMGAVWFTLKGREQPSPGDTLLFGALLALLFFYRQNMIMAAAVLAPVYLFWIRDRRLFHAGLLAGAIVAVSAVILLMFPVRLAEYALRLPGLTPLLRAVGLLPARFDLILSATASPLSLAFEPGRISAGDIYNAFLLPYLGTILIAAAALVLAAKRPAWLLAPALFFFLAAGHYLGSVGYCPTCILTYTSYFIGAGALAAGLVFAALWMRRERAGEPPLNGVMPICAAVILLNVFASSAVMSRDPAIAEGYTGFPAPMLRQTQPVSERRDMETLAAEIRETLPPGVPVLVLHNLPSVTYGVFRSGHVLPPQSLNLWQSYREVRADVTGAARPAAVQALEAEALWTDDSLARWIASGYDAVVYQRGAAPRPVLESTLAADFDLARQVDYRGWKLDLYVRRARSTPADSATARAMVCELESVRRGFGTGC